VWVTITKQYKAPQGRAAARGTGGPGGRRLTAPDRPADSTGSVVGRQRTALDQSSAVGRSSPQRGQYRIGARGLSRSIVTLRPQFSHAIFLIDRSESDSRRRRSVEVRTRPW